MFPAGQWYRPISQFILDLPLCLNFNDQENEWCPMALSPLPNVWGFCLAFGGRTITKKEEKDYDWDEIKRTPLHYEKNFPRVKKEIVFSRGFQFDFSRN